MLQIKKKVFLGLCLILSFVLPALLATNFALNHFYGSGGVVLDSGWFAYLSTNATTWPLHNPPVIGGTYFTTHISPIFYLYTVVYKGLILVNATLPPPMFFSITQGFWFGLFSMAIYSLLLPPKRNCSMSSISLALILALIVILNGVSLSMLVFPHFEIAIPSLLLSFFALRANNYKKLALLALILGLLIREDAGLHYFGVFILLTIALQFFRKDANRSQDKKYFLSLAISCFSYSILVIFLQKYFYASHMLTNIYLGTPIFHHITWIFIKEKTEFLLKYRSYIYVPLVVCITLAYLRRNILLIFGVIFVLPWITLAFFAASSDAGRLVFYYSFPILIGLTWPIIIYGFEKNSTKRKEHYFIDWAHATSIIVISFALFWLLPRDISHQYLENSYNFQWMHHWKKNQNMLNSFFLINKTDHIAVDNAAACLEIQNIAEKNFYLSPDKISKENLKHINAFIFLTNAIHDNDTREKIIRLAHLDVVRQLNNSDYSIAVKKNINSLS